MLVDALMHIGHEFMEMRPTLALDGHGIEEHVHQHRLAAADPTMDVEPLDRLALPLARGEQPAECIGLARRSAGKQFRRQVIEPSCDCKLRRITLPLAGCNKCFELVMNAIVRIEHAAPERRQEPPLENCGGMTELFALFLIHFGCGAKPSR